MMLLLGLEEVKQKKIDVSQPIFRVEIKKNKNKKREPLLSFKLIVSEN